MPTTTTESPLLKTIVNKPQGNLMTKEYTFEELREHARAWVFSEVTSFVIENNITGEVRDHLLALPNSPDIDEIIKEIIKAGNRATNQLSMGIPLNAVILEYLQRRDTVVDRVLSRKRHKPKLK